MKLVIDIDEKDYKALVGNVTGLFSVYDILGSVKNGTPLDDIKAEIREETECHYGDKCLGANCPSNTDCMIMGEHAIWIIDKYINGKERVNEKL